MGKIKVWTRQHKNVAEVLQETGRYITREEYIRKENQEHSNIILLAYKWLASNGPNVKNRPEDVSYPVWVAFESDSLMLPGENDVIIELEVEESDITPVNVTKWGMILNYAYIPLNEEDAKRHRELMDMYGVNDPQAVMSQFYPELKREITVSWMRLYDDSVVVGNDLKYGTIWELRREWVTDIKRQTEK